MFVYLAYNSGYEGIEQVFGIFAFMNEAKAAIQEAIDVKIKDYEELMILMDNETDQLLWKEQIQKLNLLRKTGVDNGVSFSMGEYGDTYVVDRYEVK